MSPNIDMLKTCQETVKRQQTEILALKMKIYELEHNLPKLDETKRDVLADLMIQNEELTKQVEELKAQRPEQTDRECQTRIDRINMDLIFHTYSNMQKKFKSEGTASRSNKVNDNRHQLDSDNYTLINPPEPLYQNNQHHYQTINSHRHESRMPQNDHHQHQQQQQQQHYHHQQQYQQHQQQHQHQHHQTSQPQVVSQLNYPHVPPPKQVSIPNRPMAPDEKDILGELFKVDGLMTTMRDKLKALTDHQR